MTREIHKQVQFVQINKNEIQSNMHKIRQYNKILLGGFFVVYLVLVSTNQAHAAVALRSFSEVNSLTASEPSGTVQGDFLVAYAKGTGNNVELTPPAGWTAIVTPFSVAYSTPRYVGAWYIVRGSSAPSYTWTGPTNAYIVVTAWTGVDTGNPIQNVFSSTTATSATPNGPLVITEVANSMLVTVALQNDAAPTLSSNPTGMTNIQTNTTSRIHSARQIIASTGGTGVRQWTFSSSTLNGLISFAIAPPPANPTISTPTSASITSSGATLGGNITAQGGSAVTARGVCYAVTATNANPQSGGSGVTCVAEGNTGTGVFTKAVTGLTQNTGYSYTAYATNTQGTAYTSASTFSTLNVNPTGVDTNSPTGVNSYYVTLSGVANPNSYTTTGHFRVYSTNPGNCNSDSGGIRYPQLSSNDISVGADTSPHTFTYTIPPSASTFLEPSTQYWYCSYAINTNGTTGGASAASFTTGDGPSSPCDPPTTGNLTIPATATCNLSGNFNGVDTGTGTTNTGALILSTTAQMTIGPSQQVAFGSFQLQKPNSSLVIARGGSLKKGGVFVHDKDGDGILDDKTQYVGSTPSAASEFVRRNTLSTNYNYAWKMASVSASTDCNPNNAYTFRNIGALVTDVDNDGYKTSSAAGGQCVGLQSVINGRTYFKDTNNTSSLLPDGQKLSSTTDCQDDPNGTPCAPSSVSASNPSSQTQNDVTWSGTQTGGAVPAGTGYDLKWCTGGSCSPSATLTNVTSIYNHIFTANPSTIYGYAVAAKNAAGTGTYSTPNQYATTAAGCSNTTVYSDNDGDGHGNSGTITRGVTTSGSVNAGTSFTVNKPADIVNGSFMLMTIEYTGGTGRTVSITAAGAAWNSAGTANNSTNVGVQMFWKYANGSEPASYTVNVTGSSSDAHAFLTSFGNVATASPIGTVATGTGNSNNQNGSSITPTAGNFLLVMAVGTATDGGIYTVPSGMSGLYGKGVASIDSVAGFTEWRTGSGATSSRTSAFSSSATYASIMVEIKRLAPSTTTQCIPPVTGAWSADNTDCDDSLSGYYQNLSTGYPDNDGDGVNPSSTAGACSGASLRPGISGSSGIDCDSNSGSLWQNLTGYLDVDNDNYSPTGSQQVCSGLVLPLNYKASVTGTNDCYDSNSSAKPGQTLYFSTDRGDASYDYDCSGTLTYNMPAVSGGNLVCNSQLMNFSYSYMLIAGQPPCISNPGTGDACSSAGVAADGTCKDQNNANVVCCGSWGTYGSSGDVYSTGNQCTPGYKGLWTQSCR